MTSIAPPLQAVVALFRGPLQSVRFADIDAAGLTSLAEEVESAATDVQALETKLAEHRALLAQKQESLLALAQQALAYARIYAEGDEALSAELSEIALPRATKPRKAGPGKGSGERTTTAGTERALEAEASAVAAETAAEAPTTDGAKPSEAAVGSTSEADDTAPKAGRRKVQRRLARPSAHEDAV